jgi:hypothetical protein
MHGRLEYTIAPHPVFYDTIAVLHVAPAFWGIVCIDFTSVVATESIDVTPWHVGDISFVLWGVLMLL